MNYKHSQFFFGQIVTAENCYIDFSEGDGELTATLSLGSYTFSELLTEISKAMTEAGNQVYTASSDRDTRIVYISADDNFEILFTTGTNALNSAAELLGFVPIDYIGANSFGGSLPCGKAYRPQCPINEFTPFEHWKGASNAAVSTAANGRSTIVSFGKIERMRCNITGISNIAFPAGQIIENNQQAKEEALEFMEYVTDKNPIEFMFDRDDPDTFDKCILESTKDSKDGVSFELYEGLGKGLRDIYETKTLVFRRME